MPDSGDFDMADGTRAPWYYDAIKTLGVPTAFVFALLYMIWTAGTWAGVEILMPMYKKQVDFIDSAKSMTEKMANTTDEINRTLQAHGQHAVENLRLNGELHNKMDKTETLIQTQINESDKKSTEILNVLKKIETNTAK